jgi:hypothetical protein
MWRGKVVPGRKRPSAISDTPKPGQNGCCSLLLDEEARGKRSITRITKQLRRYGKPFLPRAIIVCIENAIAVTAIAVTIYGL